MRAPMVVTAPDGSTGPCKVVVRISDVLPADLAKMMQVCNRTEKNTNRRSLLGGAADIICNPRTRTVTLVKPARDEHGLQSRFEAVLGKSLAYRLRPMQAEARRLAGESEPTQQHDSLSGCSIPVFLDHLYKVGRVAGETAKAATSQKEVGRKRRKTKRRGPRLAAA